MMLLRWVVILQGQGQLMHAMLLVELVLPDIVG